MTDAVVAAVGPTAQAREIENGTGPYKILQGMSPDKPTSQTPMCREGQGRAVFDGLHGGGGRRTFRADRHGPSWHKTGEACAHHTRKVVGSLSSTSIINTHITWFKVVSSTCFGSVRVSPRNLFHVVALHRDADAAEGHCARSSALAQAVLSWTQQV